MNSPRLTFMAAAMSLFMAAQPMWAADSTSTTAASSTESGAVADGQSVTEPDNKGLGNDSAKECTGKAESGGNYSTVSKDGYLGKYQVGEPKLIDLGYASRSGSDAANKDNENIQWTGKDGINSTQDFLNNSAVQESVKDQMDAYNTGKISSTAKAMAGSSTINCTGFGGSATTPITQTMLIAGAQFGAGKVNAWASGNGTCIDGKGTATNDGNGKCVTWQMCQVVNCGDIKKDLSKTTCSVTMPMIKAITCSNFTGESLSLCNAARPYLMTDGECNAAEAMSKAAKKGPTENACENSTFGPGTGSWSYALACSFAGSAVADQDGVANNNQSSGTNTSTMVQSDPECINKLKGMGVDFSVRGTINNGTYDGKACIIQNAVTSKGTALPFAGASLDFDCNQLLAMEQFGQKLKGIGITGYYGIGSTRECGPMRDKGGNKAGTITFHALGLATDFSGFLYQGRKVSMGKIWEQGTPDGQLAAQVKAIACATFRGVLSPTYKGYVNAYFHNHVETGSGHFCD